ncbi:MAG: hypothetical protein GXO74_12910 [Calditrichaeota bacterium]|nr:hypothetical protein [Calditrichota bacterium]
MRIRLAFLFLFVFATSSFAQLTLKNQFKFSRWQNHDLKIVENWTDISYQKHSWEAGARFEVNRPPDPFVFVQDSLLKNYELTFRYISFDYKDFSATVGNFYAIFGRGLVLRTYEDRNLRVDTNIDGIKLEQSGDIFQFQAIAGKMRDKYNRRKNLVWGLDGEINAGENIILGGSFLHQNKNQRQLNQIWASRVQANWNWGEFYGELVKPSWHGNFSFYNALNLFGEKWTATLEYKNYDHLSFSTDLTTEYNAAPSLTRQHAYTLLNRHPHALNMNDEKGYQFELSYLPAENWEITFNHSRTATHSGQEIFKEFYAEIFHEWEARCQLRLLGAWSYDFTTNTKNLIPIADMYYDLNKKNQLHLSVQHQHVINNFDKSEYDNDLLLVEWTRSPHLSFALVGEITNQDQLINIFLERNKWLYGQLTLQFSSTQQITLMYGSRQAGFVCVGGICRYVPEFEGWEIGFLSRF